MESKTNPKLFWKYVSNKTKTKGKIVDLLDDNGEIITDDFTKSEILNNHFASVFTNEDLSSIPEFNNRTDDNATLENIILTDEAIEKQLAALDISKAAAPDNINSRVLKELSKQAAPVLKLIYDKTLVEHKLPVQWKDAHVTALLIKRQKKD